MRGEATLIDELFNGRYRLDARLGEGGMASVYCGTDTLLRRRVAVKVLRPQYASDADFVKRFYQEAEAAARLSHPNIVNTYDVGRQGEVYFIVMELVDGPTLADVIAADGKLPEPVAIDFAAQICNALAYAHRQGILHRDIKPANILLTKDDVVKLSDFGIARAVSQHTMAMTKPGMVMGSVYYLSPEQAQGHELHESSDLYSLGIVLYQMLTGKLPYSGESPVTVALKHISDPVPMLDTTELGVSPALAAIVNKLLQKVPAHRFSSASDVASALREAREQPMVAAYAMGDDAPTAMIPALGFPQPPPRRAQYPDRSKPATDRERSPVGLYAGLAALLLAAVVFGLFVFNRGNGPLIPIGATVRVPEAVGKTAAQAQRAMIAAGFNARVVMQPSDTVAADHIIRQDPAPRAQLGRNGTVTLYVSSGRPGVGVPDVRTFAVADARRVLEQNRFKVAVQTRYDPAPKDSVIAQSPGNGTKAREGSLVTLTVSAGPRPLSVPAFVGMNFDRANAVARRLGLSLRVLDRTPIPGMAPGTIASQDPKDGTQVSAGSAVGVVVSTGGGAIAVPDVSGKSMSEAGAMLANAGLKAVVVYSIQPGEAKGIVMSQEPVAGVTVQRGDAVKLVVPVPGEIPDVGGMTLDAARTALRAAGYTVGNIALTQEGSEGKVVRTEPEAGTPKRPGESVVIYYNAPAGTAP